MSVPNKQQQFIQQLDGKLSKVMTNPQQDQNAFIDWFHTRLSQQMQGRTKEEEEKIAISVLDNIYAFMKKYPDRMSTIRQKMLPSQHVRLSLPKDSSYIPTLMKRLIGSYFIKKYTKENVRQLVNYHKNVLNRSRRQSTQQTKPKTSSFAVTTTLPSSQQEMKISTAYSTKPQKQSSLDSILTTEMTDQQITRRLKQDVSQQSEKRTRLISEILESCLIPLRPKVVNFICKHYPESVKYLLTDGDLFILICTLFQISPLYSYALLNQESHVESPLDNEDLVKSITEMFRCIQPLTQEQVNKVFKLMDRNTTRKRKVNVSERGRNGKIKKTSSTHYQKPSYSILREICYDVLSYNIISKQKSQSTAKDERSISVENIVRILILLLGNFDNNTIRKIINVEKEFNDEISLYRYEEVFDKRNNENNISIYNECLETIKRIRNIN